jgi:aminoglycoside 3-N-acetyltransferase I
MADSRFHTRRLAASDLAAMREMLAVFAHAFNDPQAYLHSQPDDTYLAHLLASPAFVAVAAWDDGRVVGGLAGYVLPKFEQARSELYIYDLAVLDTHRRQGLATSLIEELKRTAAALQVYAIFVQADHGDDPAIALYSKLGVGEEVLHFDIDMAQGAAPGPIR